MQAITLFRSITMLCGTDIISQNISGYFPHSLRMWCSQSFNFLLANLSILPHPTNNDYIHGNLCTIDDQFQISIIDIIFIQIHNSVMRDSQYSMEYTLYSHTWVECGNILGIMSIPRSTIMDLNNVMEATLNIVFSVTNSICLAQYLLN